MEATIRIEGSIKVEADELTLLVREHRTKAFYYILQMVGNREDAMDLTQEAVLRLHRHWERRDPDRSLAPWFYAILRNVAIDHLRRRSSRKEYTLDEMIESPEDEGLGTADLANLRLRLWKAIGALPDEQREVVVLRDVHGLSYAEIGEAVGIPATTVSSRLHHARGKLRHELKEYL